MTGRTRTDPAFDPIAGALVAAVAHLDPDRQDAMFTWADRYGRWISNDRRRARIYGAVGIYLVDAYAPAAEPGRTDQGEWPPATAVRDAIIDWSANPTDLNRVSVRRAARRAYNAQSTRLQSGSADARGGASRSDDWFARRGIIAAALVASRPPYNVNGVMESITWDSFTRTEYRDRLRAARAELDVVCGIAKATARTVGDVAQVEKMALDLGAELNQALDPAVDLQHLPMILGCLDTYQLAVTEAGNPYRPEQRERSS